MTNCSRDAVGRSACAEFLRATMAKIAAEDGRNCEVVIGTLPPLVLNEYVQSYECPHGVVYYMEPTSDQIAEWGRLGIE